MKQPLYIYYIWAILFGLITPLSSYGQKSLILHQELIDMEDGLSHNAVKGVTDDDRGFIWMATAYGLNRYDGYEFKIFTREDGLQNDRIDAMHKIGSHYLLLEYPSNNFDIFDTHSHRTQNLEQIFKEHGLNFSPKNILKIRQTPGDSTIWIITEDELYHFDGNKFEAKKERSSFSKYPGLSIREAPNKDCWILDERDSLVWRFDSNSQLIDTYSLHPITKKSNEVYLVHILNQPETFAYYAIDFYETIDSSSFILQKGNQVIDTISSAYYDWATEWYYLSQHNVFLGLSSKGGNHLVLQDTFNQHIKSYPLDFPLGKLFFDQKGFIWAIPRPEHKGIVKLSFSTSPFKTYLKNQEIMFAARGITEIQDSMLIITGNVHPYLLDKASDSLSILFEPTLDNYDNYVHFYDGLIDKQKNSIWLAEHRNLLLSYDITSKKVENYTYKQKLVDTRYAGPTLFQSKSGKVWLGYSCGIGQIDSVNKLVVPYEKDNGYSTIYQSHICHFHENEEGIWATSSNGIFLFRETEGIIAHYHSKSKDAKFKIPYDDIAHIYEEAGWFWLASKGGGLIHWNPKTGDYRQYTTKNGLSHNVIYAIYPDDYNNLWISSDNGIMRFNKSSKLINTYLVRDGISCQEFNTLSHCQASDGTIYFGGIGGLTAFHPRNFNQEQAAIASSLCITYYGKRNELTGQYEDYTPSFLLDHKIIIQSDERAFILKFALLDFQDPKENRYAYMIEGIDKDWQYQKENFIRTAGLPYGNYQLKIKAQGAGGYWTSNPIIIDIQILRPFYLQIWFLVIVLLLLILGILFFVRWRTQRLQERQEELEQIVQERTAQIEQQTEDLKALDKLKSRFFANISHELRTPLTLILGPLSHILDKPLDAEIRLELSMIKRNGKNLLKLVEEILDLSKLDARKLQLEEEAIDFQPFIKRLFSAFSSQAAYQKINYQLNYSVDNSTYLIIDVGKYEKIINNLLSNALKFTPSGGSIQLGVINIQDQIQLSVTDSGQGIQKEDLELIFERFFQSRQSNRPAQGGTGVGLALVKELVGFMEGTVSVESQLGKGSTFTILLPQKITQEKANDKEKEFLPILQDTIKLPDFSSGTLTILLVEDNNDMRKFVHQLLFKNYKVLTAENGVAAINILKEQASDISLIISDVMMPIMDGFTLLKTIKENDSWRHIPMIMLTARAAEQDKLTALSAGVDDYILKPFSSLELKTRVQNLIQNSQARVDWIMGQKDLSNAPLSNKKEKVKITQLEHDWLRSLEELMKKELGNENLNPNFLAKELAMSRRSMEYRIKKLTGLTPLKYIQEVRLQVARELLESGTVVRVSDACYQTGFKTPHHFSKLFAKRFGKTPKNYF